jgi:hypothetical protein
MHDSAARTLAGIKDAFLGRRARKGPHVIAIPRQVAFNKKIRRPPPTRSINLSPSVIFSAPISSVSVDEVRMNIPRVAADIDHHPR